MMEPNVRCPRARNSWLCKAVHKVSVIAELPMNNGVTKMLTIHMANIDIALL
jgi:hypothetical protein